MSLRAYIAFCIIIAALYAAYLAFVKQPYEQRRAADQVSARTIQSTA